MSITLRLHDSLRYPVAMRIKFILTGLLAGALLAGCGATDSGAESFVAPPGSGEPHLALAPTGDAVLSYLHTDGAMSELRYTTWLTTANKPHWTMPKTLVSAPNLLVNWADFPAVQPLTKTLWAAHWMELAATGGFAYDAYIAFSHDGGASFSAPQKIHHDSAIAEHGFVSVFALKPVTPSDAKPVTDQPLAGAIWLDGRQLAGPHQTGSTTTGTQLRSAQFASDGQSITDTAVDTLVCDCCQTDAVRVGSAVVVAYRGRSADNVRDIHSARLLDGRWHTDGPVAEDGWRVTGCPVNGPAIAAGQDQVAIAWYTEHPAPRVRLAFASATNPAQFNPAIDVATERPAGRVDLAVLPDGDAIVSWLQRGSGDVLIRRVGADGALGKTTNIARVGAARRAGFPQMLRLNDQELLFAITDTTKDEAGQPQTRVRTLRRPIPL